MCCSRNLVRMVIMCIAGAASLICCAASQAEDADLSQAVIVAHTKPVVDKAGEMLQAEIAVRTGVRLPRQLAAEGRPAIVVGSADRLPSGADLRLPEKEAILKTGPKVPDRAEGYAIWVDTTLRRAPTVYVVGRDDRGALFGAGRLLRLLDMREGRVSLDGSTRLTDAPQVAIRGHQLGYRRAANSYDAWDVKVYEQYIRDLAVFGTNAIELIPAREAGQYEGVLMPMDMWEMTAKLSQLIGRYGMDVWMWVPVEGDVSKPEDAERELAIQKALFEKCPYVDHIFVPGGDPGDTPPEILLPWMEKLAANLRASHPKAGVWVSNQGFEKEKNDIFFEYLEKQRPKWLTGVVFGPWTKIGDEEERARTPKEYKVRRYPDITHSVRCQYPVPEWDRAFAHTLGRECINPRPYGTTHIHNLFMPFADGFVSYSDGIHDDVNKIVWSAVGWNPKADVQEVVREYGRYFIGQDFADEVAKGLIALERHWEKPVLGNQEIERTLVLWQGMERRANEKVLGNWRFQMGLLRAYYDAYVYRKLGPEMEREKEAYAALNEASSVGVEQAIANARKILARHDAAPIAADLAWRIEELGAALYDSIGMQLDVARYAAQSPERGAVLEFLDLPLNDRLWLEAEFTGILAMDDKEGQLARIAQIVNWENPGPGSFYDDLGNATKQPHLVRQKPWKDDPGGVATVMEEFSRWMDNTTHEVAPLRLSWLDQAQTLFGTPLRMRYDGLDPNVKYRLRATYCGRFNATMRLVADGQYEVHGPVPAPKRIAPVEFDVPQDAVKDGLLDLEWQLVSGRGCQVAEVWLLRTP